MIFLLPIVEYVSPLDGIWNYTAWMWIKRYLFLWNNSSSWIQLWPELGISEVLSLVLSSLLVIVVYVIAASVLFFIHSAVHRCGHVGPCPTQQVGWCISFGKKNGGNRHTRIGLKRLKCQPLHLQFLNGSLLILWKIYEPIYSPGKQAYHPEKWWLLQMIFLQKHGSFLREELVSFQGGYPIWSMCGIFTYIWLIFMVNVGEYIYHTWILWVSRKFI